MEAPGHGGVLAALVVIFFFLRSANSQLRQEADVLLEFKRSAIPGGGSALLADWSDNSRQRLCNWTGITCINNGSSNDLVSRIELGGLQIGRESAVVNIAPLLDDLEGLVFLNLSGNLLQEAFPSGIKRCSSIITLDLSYNLLGGELPPSLGICSQLKQLDLSNNFLAGAIPDEIGQLIQLEQLQLGHNNLTGAIPYSIRNCSNLTNFDAERNNITGQLPSFLGDFRELQVLNLIGNKLWGSIPPSLANCSKLEFLFLYDNAISGHIPPEFGRLQSIQTLGFDLNFISGQIPPSLANCSSLTRILLYHNNISGEVPVEISQMRQLFTLELSGNQLTGSLEKFPIHQLQNLTYVSFAANQFHGSIPAGITNCSKLVNMDFSNNYFSGRIPVGLGKLQSLLRLQLYDNQLEGGVPSEIGNLSSTSFQGLLLQGNKLEGEVPAEISLCKSLVNIDLSRNLLSRSIPGSLCGLSNLQRLNLSNNFLAGGVPSCLNECVKLTSLDLSSNQLVGTIPPSMLMLPAMAVEFSLARNQLYGPIPGEIGSMTMVEKIDLSHNNLSGGIPQGVSRCIQLEYLDLSWNDLSGVIPGELDQLRSIKGLDFSENRLTGEIPQFLAEMQTITSLNLSFNNLYGSVPPFTNLSAVSLGGNPRLCGESIGKSCTRSSSRRLLFIIGAPILALAVAVSILIWWRWCFRRRQAALRPKSIHQASQELDELELRTELREFSVSELWDATNGYSQQNILGVSSTSTVYRATLDGIDAAVKKFKDVPASRTDTFVKELQIILSIRHRNLVKILGYCRNRSLVLEFMPNGNLDMQLHRTPCKLSWQMRLDIALGTAQALVYMHDNCIPPVVHCDLKPSNILLDANFEAHIADFGISKLLQTLEDGTSSESSTISILLRGTLGYIPPEYSYATKPTTRGDVYSFGVILLELVTGLSPTDSLFRGTTLQEWVFSYSLKGIQNIMDKSINLATLDLMDVEQVVNLGLSCSNQNYMKRPSMSDVETVLRRLRGSGYNVGSSKRTKAFEEFSAFIVDPR